MSTGPLETVRAEDFVEYFIFPVETETETALRNVEGAGLDIIIQRIEAVSKKFCKKYIWHKDAFRVSARYGNSNLLIENSNLDNCDDAPAALPEHVYGLLHFDDNIQDEWFVVALLFELSKQIDGVIIRVVDSDGEFMLIEAADHIPNWANPDTCEQRMYIFNGWLHLIDHSVKANNSSGTLSVSEAVTELRLNPTLHRMSADVMTCIQERIKNYPNNLDDGLHRQTVYLPVSAAAVLQHKPQLVAAAVRAFCHRDPIDMKACRAMKYFPPENRVRSNILFSKYLYAMLTHSQYMPDRRTGWNLPTSSHSDFKSHLLGVKLACGFEILAAQAKPSGDLQSNKHWLNYVDSLKKRGYFQNLLEGSRDYKRLHDVAEEFYRQNLDAMPYSSDVGQEILTLLKQVEYQQPNNSELPDDDDESWLNVSPEDLDAMLASRYGIKKTISANGNVDAVELTGNLTEFLERKSEWEGIDLVDEVKPSEMRPVPPKRGFKKVPGGTKPKVQFQDDHSDTDSPMAPAGSNNIDFNADAFHSHVKEMLDLIIPDDNWESNSDMSDFGDDDLDKNIDQMGNAKSIQSYMDQMDSELARTTLGKSFETRSNDGNVDAADDSFGDIENFKPVDIDVNTLKNIAHSYQSQYGGSGPASTLLGSMGIYVKPDEQAGTDYKLYNTQV